MTETKNNDCIDVMKAVLAIFIVIIHVTNGEGLAIYLFPILRTAVPIFLITSSYFFFSKITNVWSNDRVRIIRFVKRNLLLYAFWFVVLLPITLVIRNYFNESILSGFGKMLRGFFFGSTFRASWYIMALVEGVLIIYLLSRILPDVVILIITFFIQVLCCLASNYYGLLSADGVISTILSGLPLTIYNSVFVALFWIEVGKIISEHFDKFRKVLIDNNYRFAGLLFISVVLLYFEQYLINTWQCSKANDCYFMLLPIAVLVFVKVNSMGYKVKSAEFMRRFSTITYCSHMSITTVYKAIIQFFFNSDILLLRFLITLLTCIIITIILIRLSKCKHLGWLKYSY